MHRCHTLFVSFLFIIEGLLIFCQAKKCIFYWLLLAHLSTSPFIKKKKRKDGTITLLTFNKTHLVTLISALPSSGVFCMCGW